MNIAKEAYEAYRSHTGGKSLASGQPIPPWADLPDAIKSAWMVAAAWVAGLATGNGAHEHRLFTEVKRLEGQRETLLAACRLWDQGFTDGEQFDQTQFLKWVNDNRRATRTACATVEATSS